ncbi:MAG: hypothetical protein NTY73_04635 [Candidatus Micrarchaeota archaeon]|nr:hypothetical protein [Candidatus Micrarchaeota archaeon]
MGMYEFSDRASFYILTRMLHPDEQKAFESITWKIRTNGVITRDEIREIYKQHMPKHIVRGGTRALDSQLNKILKDFVDGGGLKETESVEKKAEKTVIPEKVVGDLNMPATYAKKPGEFKIQNKELVKWLMDKFGMSKPDAGYRAYSFTSEQEELIKMLRKMLPEEPFETLNKLLTEVPPDTLRKNLKILEEYDVPPSQLIPFLSEKTQDLEESIIRSGGSGKGRKNPIKKMLEYIAKSAGVESINPETIGKVRE